MSGPPTVPSTAPDPAASLDFDRLGLFAGEGDFPLLVARAARAKGVAVTCVGVTGLTSPEIESLVSAMHWIKFGKFEQIIRLLQAGGITRMIMVGRIRHASILQLASLDRRSLKLLSGLANKKADTILARVVEEFASENIEVLDSTLFLRDCMPPAGLLTPRVPPTAELRGDIDFGLEHARSIAGLDIGQTVIVKSGTIVAVEAMEGTDAAIERAGLLAGPGIVMCKVAKPNQDRRFDVPILGLNTVRNLVAVRAAGLAFPGREVLFFERDEAVALAEANNLSILAV